jgi:hypothetical protein
LGTKSALAASAAKAKQAKLQRLSMKPRKRLREDDAGDNDVDADDLEPRKELHPVLQFAVSAEDRRHMEDLELAVVDPEHYNDVSDDASLDAGLF